MFINVDQQYLNDRAEWCRANFTEAYMLNQLRATRNMLLEQTDVLALGDRTLSDEWKTYRQALRDLPANTSDVFKPVYPTQPSS
tara:strand:- start:135 stop:386 length:252 start_codon:yes stop_codon:yes gene_type:complete